MIYLPFEDRIILLGARWQGGNPGYIKEYMNRFQFTSDPDELRAQYKKLMECVHDGFGCINAKSMKSGQYNMFTADWVAGGSLNAGVWHEKIPEFDYVDGKLQSLYCISSTNDNPRYFAFMTGTGSYIGDLEDCFGSKEAFKELVLANKNAEITERLIAMLKSGVGSEEYIELDDLVL